LYSRSERARSLVAAILHPFRRGVLGFDPLVLSDAAPGAGLVGTESTSVRTSDETGSARLPRRRVDALALTPCHIVLPSVEWPFLVARMRPTRSASSGAERTTGDDRGRDPDVCEQRRARREARNARCFVLSLRSASSARSSAMSRLVSGGLLVGVEKRHVRRRTIGPVGVVRQLHRDAQIATLAARIVDLDESLTGL